MSSPRIGVLAVQGAFREHVNRLRLLGCEAFELRQKADLSASLDGLVLPGGESTAQAKLVRDLGMADPLRALIGAGLPVLGTCAGLILLAQEVEGGTSAPERDVQESGLRGCGPTCLDREPNHTTSLDREPIRGLATMPIAVRRNAYGRQLASFHTVAPFAGLGEIPMTFIRAPLITEVFEGAEVLATVDGRIVAARAENQLAVAFHPELDPDNAVHELFLSLCEKPSI